MNSKEIISVVVPVYDTEEYIVECVESLINQTYRNLEIILVNDGSTDRSPAICDELSNKYDCVKTIHQNNMGSGTARNNGIEKASGKYITFIDSDDIESRECIMSLFKMISTNSVCSVACGLLFFSNMSEIKKYEKVTDFQTEVFSGADYLKCMIDNKFAVSVVNKIYDLSIIRENNILFDTEHRFWEDLRFNLDYLRATQQDVLHIYNPMYFARIRNGSQTRTRNPEREKELYESTKALWEYVYEKYQGDDALKKSMDTMYGIIIMNYFYNSGLNMVEYDSATVWAYRNIVKRLNCKFGYKNKLKYCGMLFFPKIFYSALKKKDKEGTI